jgi:hypothetical protein
MPRQASQMTRRRCLTLITPRHCQAAADPNNAKITRIAEPVLHPNSNCVDVNYTIYARDVESGEVQMLNETHPMRHFSLPVIDLMAQITGFEPVGADGFLTGKPPGAETWSVCFVLQKV